MEKPLTLEEIAGRLGVRADDLIALLPDMDAFEGLAFTSADVFRFGQLITCIHEFAHESVYGGGDL